MFPESSKRTVSSSPKQPLAVVAVGLLIGLAVSVFGNGCAVNPATGKREISFVSRSSEIQMGREGDREILAQFGTYEDSSLADYVDRVGQKLAAVSELPELEWHFRVLNSPVVNAFALPGGYIYVSRGILAMLNSEAQLAGVIGHEIGHITARHTAQRITQSQLAQIGMGLSMILVPEFGQYSPAASTGLTLLFLKYGRDDENQSDELGIRYATRAGYDPREIPSTYASLKKLGSKSVAMLPGYMSTHPDPGDREVRTKDLSEGAAGANPNARYIGDAEYKHHINDLVYGDDPRGGYVENGVFYHPELAFEMIFPSGWEVINTAAALYASDPRSASAIQLTIVPAEGTATPDDFVAQLQARGEVSSAAKSLGSVGGWPAWVGEVEFRSGQIRNMHVAWVERDPGQYYQFMAVPYDLRTKEFFRQTLRTFRELKDPEVLNQSPARVFVTRVEQSPATLTSVAGSFPRLAVPIDEVAFLNNLREDSSIPSGYLLKVVLEPETQN